jgi:EpsI family protein
MIGAKPSPGTEALRFASVQRSHSGYSTTMYRRSLQIVLASLAIVSSAVLAYAITPREMMARSSDTFDLRKIIPSEFGEWTLEPNVRLVEPEPEADSMARLLYSQEAAYGYRDREGRLVMLLIAYGPNQSARLQLHRPELCYTAAGFRISPTSKAEVSYRTDASPLKLLRLSAQREARFEPISYWMRVGDDVATSVIERNLIRLKLVLRGKIADGALIRVSTIGLTEETAYPLHDRFIRDLLAAVAPDDLSFFVGDQPSSPKVAGR